MAEPRPGRLWIMRATYLALCTGVIFLHLLPLETQPRSWAAPDFLMAITFAWAVRRPEYVPALSVGGIMLLADLLFQRPPGLLAALTVLATEVLRSRAQANRDMPYLLEWATVIAAAAGVALAARLGHALFFIPQPPLALTLFQLGMTIAVYPVVVLVSQFVFGVRRPAPGEVDALGHRV